jgi:hypothetical protein
MRYVVIVTLLALSTESTGSTDHNQLSLQIPEGLRGVEQTVHTQLAVEAIKVAFLAVCGVSTLYKGDLFHDGLVNRPINPGGKRPLYWVFRSSIDVLRGFAQTCSNAEVLLMGAPLYISGLLSRIRILLIMDNGG